MRFKIISEKGKRLWHNWFAWRPVQVGGWTWVWLETIQRRRVIAHHIHGGVSQPPIASQIYRWEYRLPAPRQRNDDGTEYYR